MHAARSIFHFDICVNPLTSRDGNVVQQSYAAKLRRGDQPGTGDDMVDRRQGRAVHQSQVIHRETPGAKAGAASPEAAAGAPPPPRYGARPSQRSISDSAGAVARSCADRNRLREDIARPSASRTVSTPTISSGSSRSATMRLTTCNCCQSFSPK